MSQDRLSLLALRFIPGVGDYLFRQLVSYCGSAEKVFKTPRGKLLKIPGVGAVTAEAIIKGKTFRRAEQELKTAEKYDVSLLFYCDAGYPSRLKQINDTPALLYCCGEINFETPKTVGIVGTRQATEYGRARVEELIRDLVPHDALIVSGLAYGIDIHAHKEAVRQNLSTIGVMGSGIDVIYPAAHKDTAQKMLERGGLVTENAFGINPDAHHFPARNRIIAGLSDALIVVEAAERGGALITAEIANGYNKDVFAFPGNVGQSHSVGCNNLIGTHKASLITSVKDLEYFMNWNIDRAPVEKKHQMSFDTFEEVEQVVLKKLVEHNGQLGMDDLSWKCNIPVSRLASILLNLEFKGAVASLPGKRFRIKQ